MTLHNFYYFAGILFWLYVLLCILFSLIFYGRKEKALKKKQLDIDLFFQQPPTEEAARPVVKAIMEDDTLFLYFCRSYLNGICPTYASQYTGFVCQAIQVKYRSLDPGDPIRTGMVKNMARECGLLAPESRTSETAPRKEPGQCITKDWLNDPT